MELLTYFFIPKIVVLSLIQIAFAVAVYIDAAKIESSGRKLFLVPGWLCALTVLIGGMIPVIGYWLANHSTFRGLAPAKDKV